MLPMPYSLSFSISVARAIILSSRVSISVLPEKRLSLGSGLGSGFVVSVVEVVSCFPVVESVFFVVLVSVVVISVLPVVFLGSSFFAVQDEMTEHIITSNFVLSIN